MQQIQTPQRGSCESLRGTWVYLKLSCDGQQIRKAGRPSKLDAAYNEMQSLRCSNQESGETFPPLKLL